MEKNPNYRRVKGSYLLMVSCGYCKSDIAKYQKLGKGGLLRMHMERIIEGNMDYGEDLLCFNCGKILGNKVSLKNRNKKFYKMIRGRYNIRKI